MFAAHAPGISVAFPCRQPVRSFIKDTYSFCRCSVLLLDDLIEGSSSNSVEGRGKLAGELPDFVAQVLLEEGGARGEPAGAAGAGVAARGAETTSPQRAEQQQVASVRSSCSSDEHPCLRGCCDAGGDWGGSPPGAAPLRALLAIADDEAQDPQVWCCACGRQLVHARQADVGAGKLGMVLAVRLYHREGRTYLAAGYESGEVVVWLLGAPGAAAPPRPPAAAAVAATPLAHRHLFAEPVMAVEMGSGGGSGVAGAAEDKLVCFGVDYGAGSGRSGSQEAMLGAHAPPVYCATMSHPFFRHNLPSSPNSPPRRAGKLVVRHTVELRRQGIADVAIRADGRLLATAGWDGRVRLYRLRTGQPLAVLKVRSRAWRSGRV